MQLNCNGTAYFHCSYSAYSARGQHPGPSFTALNPFASISRPPSPPFRDKENRLRRCRAELLPPDPRRVAVMRRGALMHAWGEWPFNVAIFC